MWRGSRPVKTSFAYFNVVTGERTKFAKRAFSGPQYAMGFKHTLFHRLETGSILSAGAEVILPTGEEARGLGGGTTVFEPFVLFGQALPHAAFVQLVDHGAFRPHLDADDRDSRHAS